MLKERLRQALIDQAQTGNLTTYKELADLSLLKTPKAKEILEFLRHSEF